MRIWLLCHQFLPEYYAGTETVTLQTALQLKQNGHDVTVISGHPDLTALNRASIALERYSYKSLPVIRLRSSAADSEIKHDYRSLYRNTPVAETLSRLLDSEPIPDIAHFFNFRHLTPAVVPVFKQRNIPILFTATDFFPTCSLSHLRYYDGQKCDGPRADFGNCLRHHLQIILPQELRPGLEQYSDEDMGNLIWLSGHDLPAEVTTFLHPADAGQEWFKELARGLVEHKTLMVQALADVDKILAPSAIASKVLVRSGIDEEKLETLPFGLDKKGLIRNLNRGQKRKLELLFIGQITKHKGLTILVEALMKLPESANFSLHVYGDLQKDRYYSESILRLTKGDPRIIFMGSFTPDRLHEILAKHDVIVIPSLWSENTPMVLLYSQAAGLPALVSDEEGLCETIQDGKNGLTFKTGDAEELSKCIRRLIEEPDLVPKLADGTVPGFSIEDHAQALERLYKDCARKPAAASP